MCSPGPLRIALLPEAGGNPYLDRLRRALAARGAEFLGGHRGLLGWRWLIANARKDTVLYLQWLPRHYVIGRTPSFTRAVRFIIKLAFARLVGYRVVWTCHNVMPHEATRRTWIHILVRRVCCRAAELIVVHSKRSRVLLQARFRCGDKTVIVPHGNFIGAHGAKLDRAEARRLSGIPDDAFVFCFVGRLRRYKGIERLIHAFRVVAGDRDRLVIAGLADAGYDDELKKAVAGFGSVDLRTGWLADRELLALICGADALVFPFKRILNSGSVILGMSYAALCVVPRLGSLPEILRQDAAIYFDPSDPQGLEAALRRARALAASEADAVRSRAYRAAEALSWETAADRVLQALRAPS